MDRSPGHFPELLLIGGDGPPAPCPGSLGFSTSHVPRPTLHPDAHAHVHIHDAARDACVGRRRPRARVTCVVFRGSWDRRRMREPWMALQSSPPTPTPLRVPAGA